MLDSRDTDMASETLPSDAAKSWEEEWDDWWRTDRVDAVGWAALFVWAATVLVAHYSGFGDDFEWWEGWGVFWMGAGAIVLIETIFRFAMPRYRSKWGWTLFWGCAFLAIGLSELASPIWFALPLLAIAVIILRGAFTNEP